MNIYLNDFDNQRDVESRFGITLQSNEQILFAQYNIGDYCGDAWVVFARDNDLFEVHGSHCSCYGLEGQWTPETTSFDELMHRINRGGQSSYNTKILIDSLNDWNSSLKFDFDFDTLPHAEEIQKNLSFHHLIKDTDILYHQSEAIKEIKNEIIAKIKSSIIKNEPNLIINIPLKFSKEIEPFKDSFQSIIQSKIEPIFQDIANTLTKKAWNTSFSLDINNQLIFNIELPHIEIVKKEKVKQKVSRNIKR